MFKTKNISINFISFFTASLIAIVFGIVLFLVTYQLQATLITFALLLLVLFFFLKYVFSWFIDRRIKLIYKLIYNTKASKKAEAYYKYILPKKSINEVSEQVEQWAMQHASDMEVVHKNEVYRREFLQNLSHELKTPVFAIQGYVETVLDDLDGEETIAKKFLTNAQSNVVRMVHLLNDLDEIASLETGEQPINKERFCVQDLIKEVFETLSIATREKNIKAQIKKGCELPVFVMADKNKIRQVLNNLIINAAKYGRQNGNILAGIYKADDENVLIEISDDGIGIAEEHLQRIFERFYRTDDSRSRNIGGSGLGLAICKHIVEAHGKSMHVRSTLNVGTTIGFSLNAK